MLELEEWQYPYFLKRIYKYNLGENLNLKYPKKFTEKIQWLKLYDNLPIKTLLTDKILVRNWVAKKIGCDYLKPVLQICKTFDDIKWDDLPQRFYVKTNHGCKWHYRIKNKDKFLKVPRIYQIIKKKFENMLSMNFFCKGGMETQYKNIESAILIESDLYDLESERAVEYEVYCFNGSPKIYQKLIYSEIPYSCIWNEDFSEADYEFDKNFNKYFEEPPSSLLQAIELSKQLCKDFKFVRVDWLFAKDKLYFNEMTFTPYSGYFYFENPEWNIKIGNMLDLKNRKE